MVATDTVEKQLRPEPDNAGVEDIMEAGWLGSCTISENTFVKLQRSALGGTWTFLRPLREFMYLLL